MKRIYLSNLSFRNKSVVFFFTLLFCSIYNFNILASKDTLIKINNVEITVYFPDNNISGTILMLPGWNFSMNKTCENSSFCKLAIENGFVLICPEMKKSLYASEVFLETRKDWAIYPQLKFITDTLIPFFQNKFKLLKKTERNFIYGISTGARGGALILENTNSVFIAGALLSGDYDQTKMRKDNLMNGFYGSYKEFKNRWEGADNPLKNISKLKASLYIGHGKKDKVVPSAQSSDFYNSLKNSGLKINFSYKDNFGHDYTYWESETIAILKFFDSVK